MVCVGHDRDENGNRIFKINDSNYPTPQWWTEEELLTFWDDNIMGGNRYYMAMAPENSSQATQLTNYLPHDRISSTFRNRLETIHAMYDAYYETRGELVDIFTDLSDIAENVQDAVEDAIDWLFG